MFTWGYNYYGQLGQNTTTNVSSPVQVGTSSWTAVAGGYYHTAAIRSDGALFTWGYNNNGQLGQLEFAVLQPVSSPVQVGTSSWTAVVGGYYHTAAIRSDGALFTWGQNNYGQLGQNTITNVSSPVQVGTSSWTAVGGGYYHIAATRSDGALFTWGQNNYGQLGQNTNFTNCFKSCSSRNEFLDGSSVVGIITQQPSVLMVHCLLGATTLWPAWTEILPQMFQALFK